MSNEGGSSIILYMFAKLWLSDSKLFWYSRNFDIRKRRHRKVTDFMVLTYILEFSGIMWDLSAKWKPYLFFQLVSPRLFQVLIVLKEVGTVWKHISPIIRNFANLQKPAGFKLRLDVRKLALLSRYHFPLKNVVVVMENINLQSKGFVAAVSTEAKPLCDCLECSSIC